MTRLFACFAAAAVVTVGAAALTAPGVAQPYNPGYNPGYSGGYQGGPQYYTPRSYYQTRRREEERARERDRERESEHSIGHFECKGGEARITATGGSRPFRSWALSSARSVWSRQAKAAFGEEWSDPKMGRDDRHTCFPVTLGRRCEFSAIPCREPSIR